MENNKEKKFNHRVPIQIRFSDIDPINHVNNAVILEYYDVGRINYFETVLGKKLNWNELLVVIVHTENDYYESINKEDNIYVETRIEKFGTKSMHTFQRIVDKNTNKIKSTCKTVLAGFDRNNNCSVEIPENFKQMFYEFENNLI